MDTIGKRLNAQEGYEDKEVKWSEVAWIALELLNLNWGVDMYYVLFVETQITVQNFE